MQFSETVCRTPSRPTNQREPPRQQLWGVGFRPTADRRVVYIITTDQRDLRTRIPRPDGRVLFSELSVRTVTLLLHLTRRR